MFESKRVAFTDFSEEVRANIAFYQNILECHELLRVAVMPESYMAAALTFLYQCISEVSMAEQLLSKRYIVLHTTEELHKFKRWILHYVPTNKLPVIRIVVRDFDYDSITEKLPAFLKEVGT